MALIFYYLFFFLAPITIVTFAIVGIFEGLMAFAGFVAPVHGGAVQATRFVVSVCALLVGPGVSFVVLSSGGSAESRLAGIGAVTLCVGSVGLYLWLSQRWRSKDVVHTQRAHDLETEWNHIGRRGRASMKDRSRRVW